MTFVHRFPSALVASPLRLRALTVLASSALLGACAPGDATFDETPSDESTSGLEPADTGAHLRQAPDSTNPLDADDGEVLSLGGLEKVAPSFKGNGVLAAVQSAPTTQSIAFMRISPDTVKKVEDTTYLDISSIPGWSVKAKLTQKQLTTHSAVVRSGKTDTKNGDVVLVTRNDRFHMFAQHGPDAAMIEPLGVDDWHIVYTVDASKFRPDDDLDLPKPDGGGQGGGQAKSDPCDVITLLVGYTKKAAEAHSDTTAHAQLAVATSNTSLSNSDVTPQLSLVGVHVLDNYKGKKYSYDDLSRLLNPNHNKLGVLHDLRDDLYADIVVLIGRAYVNVCGEAQAIGVTEDEAFAVVAEDCAIPELSFPHEIGHLIGNRHNPEVDGDTTPYAYGHGLLNEDDNWRTMMAQPSDWFSSDPEPRILQWSNPDIDWLGDPTGDAAERDAARVWDDASCSVAAFREVCANACPHGGFFDGANCQLGAAPNGTTAFIDNGNYYYTPEPGNVCSYPGSWFDGSHCFVQSVPYGVDAFIWENNFYYDECPDCSGWFSAAVPSFAGTLNMANLDADGHYLVDVADVTGDGHADLISVHTSGSAYVWSGHSNGQFGGAVASFAGTLDLANLDGAGHYIVGVADVTGDGQADLISAHTGGSAYVWPGHSNGQFGGAVASFAGTLNLANIDGTGHYIVDVSDVDGDGRADLVSAGTDGSAYVWPGQSNGQFGGVVSSFAGTLNLANIDGVGHYVLGASDVTGDGRADLVSSSTNGSAYVWPGQSNGSFGSAVASFAGTLDMANLDGSGHHLIAVSDVNGDGNADLVSSHTSGWAHVWPGQDSGSFGSVIPSFCGTLDQANHDGEGHFMLDVADVTGDGRADLVSSHTGGSAFVWPAD